MLPRANRLTRRSDFRRVYRQGRRLIRPPFRLHVLSDPKPSPPRVAFVVSNRVAKRATERNRWKRILRESVRPNLTALPPGTDAILVLNDVTSLTPKDLRGRVTIAFTDLRRLLTPHR